MEPRQNIAVADCFGDMFSCELFLGQLESIYETPSAVLDLSAVSFADPYSMAVLLIAGRVYLKKRGYRLGVTGLSEALALYLERMDFFTQGIIEPPEVLPANRYFRQKASRRLIEITPIPNREKESIKALGSIITLFRGRAAQIFKQIYSPEIVNCFVTVISELCQNIFEHSMDSGFLTLQTYLYNRDPVIRLVIADSGIGIEESFSEEKRLVHGRGADLLKNAIIKPISGKRPFGHGLCRVNDIVKELKGSIYLRSGSSSVAFMYGKFRQGNTYCFMKNGLPFLEGTQLSFSILGS